MRVTPLILVCYSQALGEFNSVDLDPSNVAMGYLVFCVHSHCQSFDCGHVKSVDLIDVTFRFFDTF
jgi:hypothetical protein